MRILSILFLSLISIVVSAQSSTYKGVVSELEKQYKTQTITFSKEAFALLTYFDIEVKDELKNLINDIDQMIIVTPTEHDDNFYNKARIALTEAGYNNVDISGFTNANAKVFVAQRLTTLTEVHAIASNGVMVSFFGKFKYRDIKKLLRSANKASNTDVGF